MEVSFSFLPQKSHNPDLRCRCKEVEAMKQNLFIVEDDEALREIMYDYFSANGWTVIAAENGKTALEYMDNILPALILLDINLPDLSGFDVCQQLRQKFSVPVLFITARTSEADKLNGYAMGGDDYITKPFSLPVLQAKMEAIQRRAGKMDEMIQYGPIQVDPSRHMLIIDGSEAMLPYKEYELFVFLAENAGRLYTREQLLIRFWGYAYDGDERVVDDHIRKLRKILGSYRGCIQTVYKTGYRFCLPAEEL